VIIRILAVAIFALGALMSGIFSFVSASPTDPLESPRVQELKSRVGFDAAIRGEPINEQVSIVWDNFSVPPTLRAWAVKREIDHPTAAETLVTFVFRNAKSKITIEISIFENSQNSLAARRLLERANAVTTLDLSDIRGPHELGTLSLIPQVSYSPTVYWVFRNIFAEITVHQSQLDPIEIARAVQVEFEKKY